MEHNAPPHRLRQLKYSPYAYCSLAIIRRWLSPPVSHRQEIIVQTPSKRSRAAATNGPYAAEPRPGVRQGGEAALTCACTSCASSLPP